MNTPKTPVKMVLVLEFINHILRRIALKVSLVFLLFIALFSLIQYELFSNNIVMLHPKLRMWFQQERYVLRLRFGLNEKKTSGQASVQRVDFSLVPGHYYRLRARYRVGASGNELPAETMFENISQCVVETDADEHTTFITSDSRLKDLLMCEVFEVLLNGDLKSHGVLPLDNESIDRDGVRVVGSNFLPDVDQIYKTYPPPSEVKLSTPQPSPTATPKQKLVAKKSSKSPKPKE